MADIQFRVLAFVGCLLAGVFISAKLVSGGAAWLVWLIGVPLYFFVAKPLLQGLDRGVDRVLGDRDPKDWGSADEWKAPAATRASAVATRECPHCKEPMRRDTKTCPHCHEDSPPWMLHEGNWWHRSREGFWQLYCERLDEWLRLPGDHESVEDAATTQLALKTMRADGHPHSDTLRECPQCKEQMLRVAETCPHCHQDSPAWKFHEGAWWSKSGDDWYFSDGRGRWSKYEGPPTSATEAAKS